MYVCNRKTNRDLLLEMNRHSIQFNYVYVHVRILTIGHELLYDKDVVLSCANTIQFDQVIMVKVPTYIITKKTHVYMYVHIRTFKSEQDQ